MRPVRRRLFAQRNGDDQVRVYLIQRVPAGWIAASGLTPKDTDAVRGRLLESYAHWAPRMKQLITDNDGPYVDRPVFALPVPHTWQHDPSVTLPGDAAHLMPPLGVGVNLAMLDASDLALALANAATVDDALHDYEHDYEKTMLPRSAEHARALEGGAEHLPAGGLPDPGDDEPRH